jgi:hypothetical protein
VNKKTPKLSTDSLLETSKKGDIKLTEQDLGKVSGGTIDIFAKIGDIKGESRR